MNKLPCCWGSRSVMKAAALSAVLLLNQNFAGTAKAAPRTPLPPWPEKSLGIFGWDEEYFYVPMRQRAIGADQARMTESWSGYALLRQPSDQTPVAIPALDADGRSLIASDTGAVRFWFDPNWSSVAKLNRKEIGSPDMGPGQPSRLLELVNLGSQFPDIRWTLYANAEGNQLMLSGVEYGQVKQMVTAPLNIVAGQWVMLTLCYSPAGSQIWANGQLLASGSGIKPGIAGWEDRLGLVVGSSVTGSQSANGQFEEVVTFDYWPGAEQQQFYYRSYSRRALLGPVGSPEEEQFKMDLVHTLDGPPSPGEGGGSGGSGGTNSPAYNYDPGTFYVELLSATNDVTTVQLHNTVPDVMYELRSVIELTNGPWTSEQFVIGAVGATSTVTTVPWLDRTNTLFLQARSWADTDGDGLPDWWESAHGLDPDLPDTGNTGISDGYKDGDGDGWSNLEEFQNGTDPASFNTPPPPRGLMATYGTGATNVNIAWIQSLGNVTGYTIERDLPGQQTEIQLGSTTTGYADSISPGDNPSYSIRANYSSGNSAWSDPVTPADRIGTLQTQVVRGPEGRQYLVVSALPSSTTSFVLRRVSYSGGYSETNFTIAAGSLSNGIYELPEAWTSLVGPYSPTYQWYIQLLDESGHGGRWAYAGANIPIAFFDGRAQLQQNLAFQLRMPTATKDFRYKQYYTPPGFGEEYAWYYFPTNLAQAGFFPWDETGYSYFDEGYPFEANYRYRNFGFNASLLDASGYPTTGVSGHPNDGFVIDYLPDYLFSMPTNQQSISAILGASETAWTYLGTTASGNGIGISQSGGYWNLASGTRNLFGLTNLSTKLANSGGVSTLYAGGSIPYAAGVFYAGFDQPVLQTTNYYFGQYGTDPIPGDYYFEVMNTSPLLISSIGQPIQVFGYAKQAILNGYAGKFAYLGQYFDKAYKQGTTNETGVLSPYGEFLPTEPGPVELVTMPDLSTGQQGTGVVNVIKLQLDVNHDGVMDLSFSGPDNANTQDRPFRFWLNNDHDVPAEGSEPDRDVPVNPQGASVVDGLWDSLDGIINSQRDLEDFARLWIRGVPNIKSADGYAATLEVWPTSGDPHLRVYQAFESDGGIGYLTNVTTAANQLSSTNIGGTQINYGLQLGEISNEDALSLPLSSNGGLTISNFLFEASGAGSGALVFTIWKDDQPVAWHEQYIEFKDIKKLYEQSIVTNVIQTWPEMVQESRTSGFEVLHSPADVPDESSELAVFVHGWRMTQSDYYSFSESMFKRLYWQGFQGRFASLRWPTRSEDTDTNGLDLLTFNRSEHIGFNSGIGAALYFDNLRDRYPERTISVAAHSQGNIVMMEALKTLVAVEETPLDNYVLMQAAVPAQCYDISVTNLPSLLSAEQILPTPNTYSNYATGVHSALRAGGKIVNFFNTNDYALVSGWNNTGAGSWEFNEQLMKPLFVFGYGYIATNGVAYVTTNQYTVDAGITNLQTRIVTDLTELMPFVARPRSKAVGAQAGVGGQVNSAEQVDLSTAPFGFTSGQQDHSGEFNRNVQDSAIWPYYGQLKTKLFPQ